MWFAERKRPRWYTGEERIKEEACHRKHRKAVKKEKRTSFLQPFSSFHYIMLAVAGVRSTTFTEKDGVVWGKEFFYW